MTGQQTLNEHLSYAEMSRWLNLPLATLYTLVHRNEIPHLRLGRRLVRFERRAIEQWLTKRRRSDRQQPIR